MELNQTTIQKGEKEKNMIHQFQMDTDINVPDVKEDVLKILQSEGMLHITDIVKMEQYLKVTGHVSYQILYATEDEDRRLASLEGKVQIEELIYVEGEDSTKYSINCKQLEVSTALIHSRKMNIKAMIEVEVTRTSIVQELLTLDVDAQGDFLKKYAKHTMLQMELNKKDTYRIKEVMKLPGTKENIGTILTSKIACHKIDTRAGQDEITFRGEFQFFCMYISDEWKEDWVSQSVAFEGRVECYGMTEAMYHHMLTSIEDLSVDIQMDEDGEMRMLGIEATLKMDLSVYKEEEVEVLVDAYGLDKNYLLKKRNVAIESLVLQNQSKCRLSQNLNLPELKDELLQICNCSGMVQTEQIQVIEQGIMVEGILHISFLYVRGDDHLPYATWQGMVPFSHIIDCNIEESINYDIESKLEQLSISMAGNEEIEIKAVLGFHSFVCKPSLVEVIDEIEVSPYTKEELESQAGITGYIYKENDDLWALAKKYHTTVDGILSVNNLSEKDIKAGQKLLIFKENLRIL